METTENRTFTPPTGTILVEPVMRMRNSMVTDPDHEAYFLFGTATIEYCLPTNRQGILVNPFSSDEEKEWLETALDTDLNIYKRDNNFWKTHKVRLGKDVRKIDLSNPREYVDYLVLKANKMHIAPDGDSAKRKATYRYALTKEDFKTKEAAKKTHSKVEAYKALGKLEEDREEMLNFLKVYGKRVATVSKTEFLISELNKIVEEDMEGFLAVYRDKENYKLKLLIAEAVEYGVLNKDGRKYYLPGGDPLCGEGDVPTLAVAVEYLKARKNDEILSMIEARVSAAKEK